MINKTEARYIRKVLQRSVNDNVVHLVATTKAQYRVLLRLDRHDIITIFRVGNSRGSTVVWAFAGYRSRDANVPHKLPAKGNDK